MGSEMCIRDRSSMHLNGNNQSETLQTVTIGRSRSFSPLIDRIVHHDVPAFSTTFLNKPPPQLVCTHRGLVLDVHAPMSRSSYGNPLDSRPIRIDELRCLATRENPTVSRARRAMVHCLSGRQTLLQQCCRSSAAANASATRLDCTSR